MSEHKESLGTVLLRKGLLNPQELEHTLEQALKNKLRIGQMAVELGYLSELELVEALSEHTGIPMIHLDKVELSKEAMELVPRKFCLRNRVLPYKQMGHQLFVAMSDPLDIKVLDDIRMVTGLEIVPAVCSDAMIDSILDAKPSDAPAENSSDVQSLVADITSEMSANQELLDSDEDLEKLVNDAPIVKLVNLIITNAVQKKASDIHIEAYKDKVVVRYRIDGVLYDMEAPPINMYNIIVSRLKLMAGMNIAERRLPQDGRIEMKEGSMTIDLRVSTLPSIYGEGVVIRILDKTTFLLGIEQLGLDAQVLKIYEEQIKRPHGILLVTGPTGSGKTTTLYAALNKINSPEKKIITLEDPVEYQLDRINQLNVNPNIGFTFAAGLRHILRQDPDVMMVGEIRDAETADIAIRSSLTGHLVFSTLHTNDAISSITRLQNMDVDPYLIATTLSSVLAQRLVRKICSNCKESRKLTPTELMEARGAMINIDEHVEIWQGKGCDACNGSGYKGRVGIYELFVLSEQLREMVIARENIGKLKKTARSEGMLTLREDGLRKVEQGVTSLAEVIRVTQEE